MGKRTLAQNRYAVSDRQSFFLIVGDQNCGAAGKVEGSTHFIADLGFELWVKGRKRLIEQHKCWLGGQSARKRNAVTLPTRELLRHALTEVFHLHECQNLSHSRNARHLAQTLQTEGNIIGNT